MYLLGDLYGQNFPGSLPQNTQIFSVFTNPHQCDLRPHHSTETIISNITEKLLFERYGVLS